MEPFAPLVVGVAAYKGGTGKTTVAFNVGMEFARPRGYGGVPACPTVFIDFDPQGHRRSGGVTLKMLFEEGPFRLRHVGVVEGFEVHRVELEPDGFEDLLDERAPGLGTALLAVPARQNYQRVADRRHIRRLVAWVHDLVREGDGDARPPIAFVDTPPMNVEAKWLRRVLQACDTVIPVTDPRSVRQVRRFLSDGGLDVRVVVLNKVWPRGTCEWKKLVERLNRVLRDVHGSVDVVDVENAPVIQSATDAGIPLRMRRSRRPEYEGRFRDVARLVYLAWQARDHVRGGR